MKKILMSMLLCGAVVAVGCGGAVSESLAEQLARKNVRCLTIGQSEPGPEVAAEYMDCMQELFLFEDSLKAAFPQEMETEEFWAEYDAALQKYDPQYNRESVTSGLMAANDALEPYMM